MPASRIFVTLVAMLILLAALALEIDRQSRDHARQASHAVSVAANR